mgnify:CR=1 FL=1
MTARSPVVLEAFGLRLGVGGLSPTELRELRRRFPGDWDFLPYRPGMIVDRWFRMPRANPLGQGGPGRLEVIGNHIQMHLARNARTHVLVHAGVVVWNGRCVMFPGKSGAGKTTLVRAMLEAGATYMSDEYAAIDGSGMIHPYARPLALKSKTGRVRRVDPGDLNPSNGSPLRAMLILDTWYEPRALFRPAPLTRIESIALLSRNSAASLLRPEGALRAFSLATEAAEGLAGVRGAASAVVHWIKDRLRGVE